MINYSKIMDCASEIISVKKLKPVKVVIMIGMSNRSEIRIYINDYKRETYVIFHKELKPNTIIFMPKDYVGPYGK